MKTHVGARCHVFHFAGAIDRAGLSILVPDLRSPENSASLMSLWRWTRDPALAFPQPVQINRRNFRSRKQIEEFKDRMLRNAIRQRAGESDAR